LHIPRGSGWPTKKGGRAVQAVAVILTGTKRNAECPQCLSRAKPGWCTTSPGILGQFTSTSRVPQVRARMFDGRPDWQATEGGAGLPQQAKFHPIMWSSGPAALLQGSFLLSRGDFPGTNNERDRRASGPSLSERRQHCRQGHRSPPSWYGDRLRILANVATQRLCLFSASRLTS